MNDWVGLIIVLLVILIVWWLLTRFAKQGPEEFELHHEEHHEKPAEAPVRTVAVPVEEAQPVQPIEVPVKAAPLPLEKAAPVPEDLIIIEGIGPKVKKLLESKGISTFINLADADPVIIKKWLSENGMAYMDPTTWPQQARLVAEGKMEEFARLTESLKGGRKS